MEAAEAEVKVLRKFALFFLYLIFISKISFTWMGIPGRLGFFIYQGGLHPYLHIIICGVVGLLFLWRGRKIFFSSALPSYHRLYKVFVVGLLAILTIQTFLQMIFDGSGLMAIAALLLTYMLIAIYGFMVPKILNVDDMMKHTAYLALAIVIASLGVKLVGSPDVYKGNRFIGIFKHIPHMVSCATLGFIFLLNSWVKNRTFKNYLFFGSALLIFAYTIILTGTRSALFASLIGGGIFFTFLKSQDQSFQLGRLLLGWVLGISLILFGSFGFQYAQDLITGKAALGSRDTQNGLEERLEEVYRGTELFEKSPYLGLGLLSKFGDGDGEMVDSYNSFQDPHNLFVSAAVVGGWPLAIWISFGVIILSLGFIKSLFRRETPSLTVAAYIAGHLPILLIYHIHLSIGGIADRYYWLVFAYLALILQGFKQKSPLKTE